MKTINISQQKFGKLTALKVVSTGKKRLWKCLCDCGEFVIAPTFELRSGNRTRCDKCRCQDLTGKTFNNLTVIKFNGYRKGKNRRTKSWKCRCICGKIITVDTCKLRCQKGCGCEKNVPKRTPKDIR